MSSSSSLFHHLSLGQVLNRTVTIFLDRLDIYMTLSAVVLIPVILAGILFLVVFGLEAAMVVGRSSSPYNDTATAVMDFAADHAGTVLFFFLLRTTVSIILTLTGQAAIVRAAADSYAEQPQGWYTCLKWAWQAQFLDLLGAAAMIWCPVIAGAVVLFILLFAAFGLENWFLLFLFFVGLVSYGIGLFIWFPSVLLTYPVIVVEQKGPINSIRRSFEITKSRRCYVFCAIFILWVMETILVQLLHNIFNKGGDPLIALLTPAGIFMGYVPQLLFMPLVEIATLVLYISIRVDKEGLSKSVLQRELVQPEAYRAPLSSLSASNIDYRQVSLMEEGDSTVAQTLVSDFA